MKRGVVLRLPLWIVAFTLAASGSPARAESDFARGTATTWLARETARTLETGSIGVAGDAAGAAALASGGLELNRRQPEPTMPPARRLERRQRPNTVSVGVQGQYGGVRGNSRLADGFDHGPGYAFRFRYNLSPNVALGFSFEHQRFGSIETPVNVAGDFADSHVVATTVSVEGLFFSHREREAYPYFIAGFGFATPDVIFTELQSSRVNEGIFGVAGIGFERFIRPRFSLDLSLRGYALVSNSEFTSIGEASLGIHLYPGD